MIIGDLDHHLQVEVQHVQSLATLVTRRDTTVISVKIRTKGSFKRTRIEEVDHSSIHPDNTGQPPPLHGNSVNYAGLTGTYKHRSFNENKGSIIAKLVENKPVDTLGILSQEKSSMLTSQHEKSNACKAGLTGAYKQNSEGLKISEVSVNDPYGPTVAASLILKVKINGVDVDAVVDTAAQVTIISEKFMKKLQPPLELKSSVTLKGAGAENKIKARYANRVSIRTGKTETKWQIIVADITDPVLLGLDFYNIYKL
ncbi:unnamed protein product [Mytilus edulis]|uniref:Peptidase A2 domain-containing protein n=1 Tax=Mytilus edulis TaxID=6550 RepID=A0A8S3SKS7_MYTED|nr:unnamed protein product [Mytilus edulis]